MIELQGPAPERRLQDWICAGFEAIDEVDHLMSAYRSESDLSRLNKAKPGEWIAVDPLTMKVLKASNELWRTSGGVFDIRCGAAPRRLPPIEIRGRDTRKTGPWRLDLGGIAKGFAVDWAVETIQRLSKGCGVSGIVNAGGDLRRWGIAAPSVAVATSAVRTPENKNVLSPARHVRMPEGKIVTRKKAATVCSDRCLWSDALTKVVLMGSKKLAAGCLSAYGAKALIFGASGRVGAVMG
jgi:thiamine biosynthesis lipoprotein